jgi:hypothetical protein
VIQKTIMEGISMFILRLISLLIILFATPAWAVDYYVRNGGNDSNDGTSHTDAWQTIAKVNSSVSGTGDRVFFLGGDSWKDERIIIDWDGATVGGYYWTGSSVLIGTNLPGGYVRPVIEGTLPTYVNASNQTDGFPNNAYYGLVHVNSQASDSTIQDLHIKNSGGIGIITNNTGDSNVYRCTLEYTATVGIMIQDATGGTIEDNDLEEVAMAYRSCTPSITTSGGPSCTAFPRSANLTVKGNTVKNSCGEAFQTSQWSNNITFENNYIQDTRLGFNLYANAGTKTHTITVKNNIVLGTTDHTKHTWAGTFMGPGIYFNDLNRNSVHDIYIYNNVFSGNLDSGVRMSEGDGDMYNILIYANTVAGTQNGIRISSASTFTGTNEIKNNIFTDIVNLPYNGSTEANLDWDYNHWDSTPAAEASNTNDRIGDPNLVGSNWTNVSGVNVSDFAPQGGSSAIDAGVSVTSYNYRLTELSVIPNSALVTTSYVGSAWDMGAIEYNTFPQNQTPTCVIDSPVGNQSIAVDASLSFSSTCTDSDGSIDVYNWDFDNSGIAQSTDEDPGSKTFAVEGTFNVCVTASDNLGAVSAPACVQVSVGTPSTPTSYVNWQLENDLTDDNANQALTDGDSISYAGSEPDPPGYGSNGAVFNGTSDYLYVTKANIGNHLCRGTSTECTIIVGFTANTSDTGYLWAYYDPDDDGLAVQYNGTPRLITGYNSGDSYQFLSIPHSYGAASVVLGLSLDMTTKEYVYSSKEMGSATFYDIDHNSNPLIGTLHDPDTDLTIGARNDGVSKSTFFNGTIWWVEGYDTALSLSELHDAMENASQSAGANVTVDTGTTIPYITIETGTNDLNLEYVSGTGTPILLFQGTVSAASNHTSAVAVDYASGYGSIQDPSNKISGNVTPSRVWCPDSGKTFGDTEVISVYVEFASNGSEDLTLPTAGASGSLSYESPIYIDTTDDTIDSTCAVASGDDTWACVSADHEYRVGQQPRMKMTFTGSNYFNDGQSANIALVYDIDAGSDLVFQPTGYGIGGSSWGFEAQAIESNMVERGNLAVSLVSDMDRDYITTGVSTVIEDAAGNELDSYDLPQVGIDGTYSIKVDGGELSGFGPASGASFFYIPDPPDPPDTFWTEVDPNDYFTVPDTLDGTFTWTDLPMDEESYTYKDYGTDYFDGDFTHRFVFNITDWDNATLMDLWGVGAGTMGTYQDKLNLFNGARCYIYNGTVYCGLAYSSSQAVNSNSYSTGTTYYVTSIYDKDGGTNSVGELVSTFRTGSHVGTVAFTITGNATPAMSWLASNGFNYLAGPAGWGAGSGSDLSNGTVSGIEIIENLEFTGYTEVDTGGVLTVGTDSVTATNMPHGTDAYTYDDISSSPITTSLTIQFEFTHTGYSSTANSIILAISEGEGDWDTYAGGSNIGLVFAITGNAIKTIFAETDGTMRGVGTSLPSSGTKYYVTIEYTKAGGTFGHGECLTTWRTGSHTGTIVVGPQSSVTIDSSFKNHSFTRTQLGGPSLTGTGNAVNWVLENLSITES